LVFYYSKMKAEIVPVGTEILLGNIVDTNSAFLASQLPALGIDLYFISTVGDNQQRLVDTLRQAWSRADIIITTGGLGPTQDDITREAIGELLGEELKLDEKLWQDLQRLLRQYSGEVPPSNIKQATVIPSAQILPNPIGTAPGWWVEKSNHIIIALPGPPDEMKIIWEQSVLPRLRQKTTGEVILSRTIKTFKIAEAKLGELLSFLCQQSNPTLATYINPDGVYLRITAKARQREEAERLISQSEEQIRELIGPNIWGVDEDTLVSVVGRLLQRKNLTLAIMESCTEGLLGHIIASTPGSSSYFKGGLLASSTAAKRALGLMASPDGDHDRESSQIVEAMAEMAHTKFNADVGLGLGGTINPNRNCGDAFVTVKSNRSRYSFTHALFGNQSRMKQRAVYAALFDLRKILLEEVI